jgi:protein ImuB
MFAGIYCPNVSKDVSLAEFAYTFSPLVEEAAANTIVMDIEGCDLLFGSPYELATEIAKHAIRSKDSGGLGCKVNVALAANPDAALHAARFCKGITFTAPGEELICLGELPLTALSLNSNVQSTTPNKQTLDLGPWTLDDKRLEEIIETLKLWGIRTFREFAELPVAGVSERLGQDGVKLQQLAAGKTERHLKLRQAAPVFENSIELEHPIAELEPLSFIFARLLNMLCARLNAYALATNELRVQMRLDDQTSHERKLNLPYPMRDHKVFLKLLLLDTEMHPPQAAVVAVSVNCEPVKPRVLQTGLFIPLAPEPEKLELTLARLAKLVGAENIGSLELVDTHRPDAFRVKRFVLKESKQIKRRSSRQSAVSTQQTAHKQQTVIGNRQCLMGFRVFRPPLRALVQAARGYPTEISAWDKNRSVYGKIVRLAGPWRTTGNWWRSDTWARDEWDVAVESNSKVKEAGGHTGAPLQILCRIYRELRTGTWFVEGIYD